jgi:hypothetical protein
MAVMVLTVELQTLSLLDWLAVLWKNTRLYCFESWAMLGWNLIAAACSK